MPRRIIYHPKAASYDSKLLFLDTHKESTGKIVDRRKERRKDKTG